MVGCASFPISPPSWKVFCCKALPDKGLRRVRGNQQVPSKPGSKWALSLDFTPPGKRRLRVDFFTLQVDSVFFLTGYALSFSLGWQRLCTSLRSLMVTLVWQHKGSQEDIRGLVVLDGDHLLGSKIWFLAGDAVEEGSRHLLLGIGAHQLNSPKFWSWWAFLFRFVCQVSVLLVTNNTHTANGFLTQRDFYLT